ncbi:MAG: peptide chain release factor N(5)-glutamine methyltransferase, partial [Planctomycetota bacterium]|nr:peptide chain release factor N(5)-glutamine methyltransferase [Planctomycetota bacterium]
LAWMTEAFTGAGIDSPRLCAELLLSHVIGCERLRLYMEADRPASPLERSQLRALVSRALKHEPTQYLVGEAWFFSLPYHVDRRVLIPRPSTETIIELALQYARVRPDLERATIADVCTGSGCIAITLAKRLEGARVAACDISPGALEVAKMNAHRHKVEDRIDFLEGDLVARLLEHPIGREVDVLAANPPYIPDAEWEQVEPNVKEFEPESALRGGADGLLFVGPLIAEAPKRLREGGLLLIEIAASTALEVEARAKAHAMLRDIRIEQDSDGLPRVLRAVRA